MFLLNSGCKLSTSETPCVYNGGGVIPHPEDQDPANVAKGRVGWMIRNHESAVTR